MSEYNNKFEGVEDLPIRSAVISDEVKVIPPEERKYTLFLWFVEGFEQEKTFEWVTGQSTVRELVIENSYNIDFTKSFISSWNIAMNDSNGIIRLVDFMHWLDELRYTDNGELVFNDGFNINDFLLSLTEIADISEAERENYINALHLAQQNSKMIDINHLEEGEDI